MMTNDMADTAKLALYINEARTMGIEVLPPDVNESQVHFAPAAKTADSNTGNGANGSSLNGKHSHSQAIRFGLAAIKGVGEVAVESILRARSDGGRFSSLAEMCERVDGRTVNRKVLEALIKCGACDSVGRNRATMFGQIDHTLARAASIIGDRQRGQSSLFGVLEERASREPESIADLPEWSEHEL